NHDHIAIWCFFPWWIGNILQFIMHVRPDPEFHAILPLFLSVLSKPFSCQFFQDRPPRLWQTCRDVHTSDHVGWYVLSDQLHSGSLANVFLAKAIKAAESAGIISVEIE